MEFYLTNQELHEFAQWFSFHYKNDEIGEREDIDTYINTFCYFLYPN